MDLVASALALRVMPLSFKMFSRPPAEPSWTGLMTGSIADRARDPQQGVAIVGAGRMGCAIGGELARRGLHVTMFDETDFTRARAKHNIQAALLDLVTRGLLPSVDDCKDIMNRVRVKDTLEETIAGAVVIFEAVIDDLELKRVLFQRMVDAGSTAILTTNSIRFSAREVMEGTKLTNVWGCRFFMPGWFIDDVEVDTGGQPDDQISPTLASLGFQVCYFVTDRRRLSGGELQKYDADQRRAVADEKRAREFAERERENHGQERAGGGEGDATAEARAEAVLGEPCAVCLDAPRSALFKPCGHISTCMECADKLQQPRQCVTCRQHVQEVLPWRDL